LTSDYTTRLGLRSNHATGSAANVDLAVKEIGLKSGQLVELPRTGVTVVVGGNNVGKSTLLRELHGLLTQSPWNVSAPSSRVIVDNVLTTRSGNNDDMIAWLAEHVEIVSGQEPGFVSKDGRSTHNVPLHVLNQLWGDSSNTDNKLGPLGHMLVHLASSRDRFALTATVDRRKDFTDPPSHPIHRLEDSPNLLTELNLVLKYVFSAEVTLDWLSGKLGLRYGTVDVPIPRADEITPEYRDALGALPHIAEQGDGFVSAVGLLLPLISSWFPIVLIDEPEAFLHPPQAFRLGHQIMRLAAARNCQVIVATHDQNFLAGVLSASSDDYPASILRLSRKTDTGTAVDQVLPDNIKSVWSKPQLRFSNVLDGVFHDAVVVAENDRDCLFYQSAVDAAAADAADRLMFTPCYGKNGAAEIVRILRAASVPTVVVLDLDALNNVDLLKKVTDALGADWTQELDDHYRIATAEFRNPPRQKQVRQVLGAIKGVLGQDLDARYTKDMRTGVQESLSIDSPWKALKDYGMAGFRAERARADKLVSGLADIGIVVVEVGELEHFDRSLGVAKGSNWVPAALEAEVHKNLDAQRMSEIILRSIAAVRSK
jgi:energy-coupling factor transporter ATP-binding protein EcfA2